MKKTIHFLLLASLAAQLLTSCGSESPGVDTTAASTTSDKAETSAAGYDYPAYDGKGEVFTIFNSSNSWSFYTTMDLEETTGDSLDDAVYNRNRNIEERFNIVFEVVEEDMWDGWEAYQTGILSGDYIYDVGFIPSTYLGTFITEGYLYNLLDYPEFRLDSDYYDQSVNQASRIGSEKIQYFASAYTSLSSIDGALGIFFNEDMLEDLSLDTPYQAVRDGKWTLDMMGQYIKAGTNLNGDDSFTWDEAGSALYGLTSQKSGYSELITGGGVQLITINNGTPAFSVGERFYNVLDKLDSIFADEGAMLTQNSSNANSHYETIFKNGRALFVLAELKASSKYRDMNDNYGVVPAPKYYEAQEDYYTYRTRYELMLTVPVTNPDPERAGIIMDAMAYQSYTDILPIYYDYRVSQKQLRNEESIEMLDIIRRTMIFDIGFSFGWTAELTDKIGEAIAERSGGYATIAAEYESSIRQKITSTMEELANE
ncbi:MAG: extracellular solute-binding protein [Clostridia bacterium]|nr:extracellular solute-binding protein [Clostridia bacterium]